MGFYLPDTNQIRLRISYRAYETILQDISEFHNIPQKKQISSFLNRMLRNFHAGAEMRLFLLSCLFVHRRGCMRKRLYFLFTDLILAHRYNFFLGFFLFADIAVFAVE